MARSRRSPLPPFGFLGIDAGGTRTIARWESEDGREHRQQIFGPANVQLLDDPALSRHLVSIARDLPRPIAVAIGMAGARTERDRERIRAAARKAWPQIPCVATHDLETALAAAPADRTSQGRIDVLVLSGTGSCCYGVRPDGRSIKVGGWGHLLGDQASGYDIAMSALRRSIAAFDVAGRLPTLGRQLLAALNLNEPDDLIPWIRNADKAEIASLAPLVFAATGPGSRDPIAREIVETAARTLASAALACAARVAGTRRNVRFVLAGSVLLQGRGFASAVTRLLRRDIPGIPVTRLTDSAAIGAVRLARRHARRPSPPLPASTTPVPPTPHPAIPIGTALSPTEERNPRSMKLDRLSSADAVELMVSEDERLPSALRAVQPQLLRALGLVTRSLSRGGRLFYVGAGTSGRLGILDASECPPTFRTPPDLVQGVIAGGVTAIFRSVEGAEDDVDAGARAMVHRGVGRRDVVVGIAASGRTPFVWGALSEARRLGAKTVLLAFNPHLRFRPGGRPDVVLVPPIGPEVLTGSTRLKAGTATKMVLNILTTLAMVRLGKVVSNLMVDVNPANAKLRERALRIVRQLVPVDEASARAALEQSGWIIQKALTRLSHRSGGRMRS